MIIHADIAQGTPEWHLLRAGIPTSSAFEKIVTPTGKKSEQREKYMLHLLGERLLGKAVQGKITSAMEDGAMDESEAVAYYEFQRSCRTVPVGFITNDEETIGASPDRLVGDDGLLEIKCPSLAVHMAYLVKHGSPFADYKIQCMGQLWITGRKWVEALSYYKGLPWAIARIERDDEFIFEKLAPKVEEFSRELEELHRKHAGLVGEVAESEVADFSQAHVVRMLKDSLAQINGRPA